jgi:probable rRNA maturation factor
MPLRFDIIDEYDGENRPFVDMDAITRALNVFTDGREGETSFSAVLSLVPRERIRGLNARYRDIDEETDVLSFPLWETEEGLSFPCGWEEIPLGDVVISPEYILESSISDKLDYNKETALVIIHGILHLFCFDHDTDERKQKMWREQDAILERYGNLVLSNLSVIEED